MNHVFSNFDTHFEFERIGKLIGGHIILVTNYLRLIMRVGKEKGSFSVLQRGIIDFDFGEYATKFERNRFS